MYDRSPVAQTAVPRPNSPTPASHSTSPPNGWSGAAGRPLDLTVREYALLALFFRHASEVLSRTRIYEQVWDEQYDGISNTLEVHVMELRKKLEGFGPWVIHTMRGRGYVFGEEIEE